MKRAFNKDVIRLITHSLGRFLALVAIVALGTGFYAGLRMTMSDMKQAADTFYDGTALMDIRVLSTLGLSDSDIAALHEIEGVWAVMPAFETDVIAALGDEQYTMRVHSLPAAAYSSDTSDGVHAYSSDDNYLNRPILSQGSWPKNTGECVLSSDLVDAQNARIGDEVRIIEEAEGMEGMLVSRAYTVVGFVSSSYYATSASLGTTSLGSGSVQQYMFVPESDFSSSLPYTEAFLAVAGAREECAQSKAYKGCVQTVMDRVKDAAPAREQARADEVRAEAQKQLDEAYAAYEQQKADAEGKLSETESQLDAAADVLAEYESAKAKAGIQLLGAEDCLRDSQKQIDSIENPRWYVMDRTTNFGVAGFDADANRIDSIAQLFPLIFFLVAALVALTTMTRMVEEERILIGTYKALGYSRIHITMKYIAYAALASVAGSVIGIAILSQILPLVIMGAYSIIYFVPTPPLPFLIDKGLAGMAAGLGIGVTLIATAAAAAATLRERPAALMLPRAPKAGKRILLERVTPLWKRLSFSWKVTFRNLFRYKKRFIMTIIGVAGCTALLLTGLGLSDAISDVIDNQFGQILAYNTTITLENDEDAIAKDKLDEALTGFLPPGGYTRVQYENMQATGHGDASEDVHEDVRKKAHEDVQEGTREEAHKDAQEEAHEDAQEGVHEDVRVMVARTAPDFGRFVTMRTRRGHDVLALDDKGVILTEKLAKRLGASIGDKVFLTKQDAIGNATGAKYEVAVSGIMENYIYNYAFMSAGYYESITGEKPPYSTILALAPSDAKIRAAFNGALSGVKGVRTVAYNDETIDTYREMLSSINTIVLVLIIAAALLVFVVLYNLTNINITERQREIATLKVLGFTSREVDLYIYREVLLLSLIGALVGLALGIWMESFVVVTAEVNQVMFGRIIHPSSFIIAFALTMVFSVVVMIVMRRKLSGIDMVKSLKSNE